MRWAFLELPLVSALSAVVGLASGVSVPSAPLAAQPAAVEVLPYPGESLRDGIQQLARHYEQNVLANPQAVVDHVGMVDAYTMLWCFGFVPRDDVLPKIKHSARQAVLLDEQDAGARTALGIVKLSQWDWAAAERELSAAVRLDPHRASSHHWYALHLAARGLHPEAMQQSEQALLLDSSLGMQVGKASIHYFGRDWPGLIKQTQHAIKQDPTFAPAHDWLGMGYVQQQRFEESIATYERAVKLSGGLAEILAGLGHAYALGGERDKAISVLQKLQRLDKQWYVPPVQIAYVHVGLGEYDEAIQMLERAYEEHSWELVFLTVEPWFDPIRTDPRFVALTKKLNFPE